MAFEKEELGQEELEEDLSQLEIQDEEALQNGAVSVANSCSALDWVSLLPLLRSRLESCFGCATSAPRQYLQWASNSAVGNGCCLASSRAC